MQLAAASLGSLPLPPGQPGTVPFAELLGVLRAPELQQGGDVAAQHALCLVERELFHRAAGGFAAEAELTQQEVNALESVVDEYVRGNGEVGVLYML